MNKVSGKPENIFQLFFKGMLIYLGNIIPFSRAMIFPVFGQLVGIILILGPVYFYRQYFLLNIPVEQLQENIIFALLGMLLIIIPGFAIFLKAFWDYMVVMVSLNSMSAGILNRQRAGDFKYHNASVKEKSLDYITLLFILMAIWLVLLAIPFAVLVFGYSFLNKIFSTLLFMMCAVCCLIILGVLSVYLCLSFQIFAFEKIKPLEVLKQSFNMIKNNFWRTVTLGILLFILTGALIPFLIQLVLKNSPILTYISMPVESYINILSENPVVGVLTQQATNIIPDLASEITLSIVGAIATAFVLPLGSACFTLLYFDIKKRNN